jgi:hypothetical protein
MLIVREVTVFRIIISNYMKNTIINELFDQLSKILKNDQHYSTEKVGELMGACISRHRNIEQYYAEYPPLLDVAELGAALGYEGSGHRDEILKQIRYKMAQLKSLLPDIS